MDKPRPIPLAMIICDTIIEDRATHKKSLIGIFSNIKVKEFPARHYSMNIFCSLTEGIGEYQGCLRCTNLKTNEVIINMQGAIKFPNRLAMVEFSFELKNIITFPSPGQYIFELLCDEQPVISRKFMVSKMEDKSEEEKRVP